jgi:hypothetical protein
MDDTDNLQSRGTGHLARAIAEMLSVDYSLVGVVRHQLLFDPRVKYTAHNSSKSVILDVDREVDPMELAKRIGRLMMDDFQPGSDPGVCVAHDVPEEIIQYGRRAQRDLLTQEDARALAAAHSVPLLGLGGDEGGVIGALAAVGLAASGEDGRYMMVGRLRALSGLQTVAAVLEAGIAAVETSDGAPVTEGLVQTDKMRPARRRGLPVAVVEWREDHWLPLKLD